MALTFDGRGATIALVETSSGDEKLSGMKTDKISFSIKTNKVVKAYLGEVGSDITTFYDSYELSLEYSPNSAIKLVDFMTLVLAKLQGKAPTTEFAARFKLVTPDSGAFQVLFKNVQWEEPSFDMGGQQEIFKSTLKGSGKELQWRKI